MRKLLISALFACLAGVAQAQNISNGPPPPRGQIPGGTGVAANAGNIGEKICAPSNCTLIPCTTTTGYSSPTGGVNITSNTLTPGTWQIEGYGGVDASSGTIQSVNLDITSTSGGGAGGTFGYAPGSVSQYFGATGSVQYYIPPQVVSVTTSTTYYLSIVYLTLSAGTAGGCGGWIATRIQ